MSGIITAATPTFISMKRHSAGAEPPDRLQIGAPATPVMTSDTTSGITVIRIAFTQIVPIGTSRRRRAAPHRRGGNQQRRQRNRDDERKDTRALSLFTPAGYIIRSPPLMSSEAPVM